MTMLKVKKEDSNNRIDKIKDDLLEDKDKSPFNVIIDTDVHCAFKSKCAKEKVTMSKAITNLMLDYINS